VSIVVICSTCGTSIHMAVQYAGKRATCPKCYGTIQVPLAAPRPKRERHSDAIDAAGPVPRRQAESPGKLPEQVLSASGANPRSASTRLHREILAAFEAQEIEPADVPWTYHLGIMMVSAVMVILPMIYLGLILLVVGLMYLYVGIVFEPSEAARGRSELSVGILSLGPLAIGAVVIAFMVKPLLARPAKTGKDHSLTREEEPLLFAFVDRICRAVRSPQPARIDVDCRVNASAGFRRGLWSMLGDDLVLTIGLPLVAGLNTRQLAGVLAHEFGHFTQATGMRLGYLARATNHWFARVVYERDQWDQWLDELAERLGFRLAIVLHLARFFVWCTRKILRVLMVAGLFVSGFLQRQQEYDADRYGARLTGSDDFEKTWRRIALLDAAAQQATANLGEFHKQGRLGDDLPRLILASATQLPIEVSKKTDELLYQAPGSWFDLHPAPKDRTAAATRENAPGIFHLERPAALLFADFDGLSKEVTWDHYRAVFNDGLKRSDLHPVEELLVRQGQQHESLKALGRYFRGLLTLSRPLRLPSQRIDPPRHPRETIARVKAARQKMLAAEPQYKNVWKEFSNTHDRMMEADRAVALLRAGLRPDPSEYGFPVSSQVAVGRARREAIERQMQISLKLDSFEEAAGIRLQSALQLVFVPQVAQRFPGAKQWQRDIGRILPALRAISRHTEVLLQLDNTAAALGDLLVAVEGNRELPALMAVMREQMGTVLKLTITLRASLMEISYPFDHAQGEMPVAEYALPELPPDDDPAAIFKAGRDLASTLQALYRQMVGRLCVIAEHVESLLRWRLLPE